MIYCIQLTNVTQVEEVVNSVELQKVVDKSRWDEIWAYIMTKIGPLPDTDTEDRLEADLHDWWKNGNMRHWTDSEMNAFQMSRWRLGDDPFFWSINGEDG